MNRAERLAPLSASFHSVKKSLMTDRSASRPHRIFDFEHTVYVVYDVVYFRSYYWSHRFLSIRRLGSTSFVDDRTIVRDQPIGA